MSYNSKSCSTTQGLLLNFHRQPNMDVEGKKKRSKQGVIQEEKCVCPQGSEGRTNFCQLHCEVHTPACQTLQTTYSPF